MLGNKMLLTTMDMAAHQISNLARQSLKAGFLLYLVSPALFCGFGPVGFIFYVWECSEETNIKHLAHSRSSQIPFFCSSVVFKVITFVVYIIQFIMKDALVKGWNLWRQYFLFTEGPKLEKKIIKKKRRNGVQILFKFRKMFQTQVLLLWITGKYASINW